MKSSENHYQQKNEIPVNKFKNVSVLFLVLSLIYFYCGKKSETPGTLKSEVIGGVKNVYNTSTPLKGSITFEVEKLFEIDSTKIDGENFAHFQEGDHDSEKTRVAAIIDTDEQVVTPLLEAKNAGFARIKAGNTIVVYANPELTPVILHSYNPTAGKIYLCVNNEYKIIVKNLKGEPLMVIHREHQKIKITPEIAKEIMEGYTHWSPDRRQVLEKNLPRTFTAVRLIKALPNGFFVVNRIVGPQKSELDIFDKDGQFVNTVKPSEDIPDLKSCIFFKDMVGSVSSEGIDTESRDVYREFRIKNFTEVFRR